MNPKQIAYGLGILLVLAIIFGWLASFSKEPAQPMVETHVLNGTPTATGDYAYQEEGDYHVITASYPAKTPLKGEADQRARLIIEQGLSDEIQNFKDNSQIDSITPNDAQMQGITGDRKYTLDMQYKEYRSAVTVSYVYTVYVDTLGAHPNGYFKTFVFDGEGTPVMLRDLFTEGSDYLTRLSALATAQVTARLQAGLETADVSGAIFPEGLAPKEENFQNFYLDGNTLVILIPPYQVAAYAAGSFEVRVPLSELTDVLVQEVSSKLARKR